MRSTRFGSHGRLAVAAVLALVAVPALAGLAAGAGQSDIALVRQATVKYHDLDAALADGYTAFYICTEEPEVGAMGQHFVNPALVGDPALDPLRPEVLVYAPQRSGGYRLVALEYVTLRSPWEAEFGDAEPTVLGQHLHLVPEGNRYGLPDFYQVHLWLWQGNPRGLFDDWNPNVSCLGQGDSGG
jgi:hypothetical protein